MQTKASESNTQETKIKEVKEQWEKRKNNG